MSDDGFHEIQLSGKQLVFFFMAGAVLLVVSFLLGVDVGRGVPAAPGDTTVFTDAATTEQKPPTDPAGGTTADPALSYHDLLLGQNAALPKPEAGEPASQPPQQPPPPPPGNVPPPVAEPATSAAAASDTPAPPAAAAGEWFLQMGAYSTRAVAEDQVAKLTRLKAAAFFLSPSTGSADQLFRVRVGPFPDRAEAEQVKRRLERQGFKSLITR
jgi:cell division protein FtsN